MSNKPIAVIKALADGLTDFLSFQSRCGLSSVHNEYLLYRPIVEIVGHREGWSLRAEWFNRYAKKMSSGDHKRIDFVFRYDPPTVVSGTAACQCIALEVKWARNSTNASVNVTRDVAKLRAFLDLGQALAGSSDTNPAVSKAYLLVAGLCKFESVGGDSPRLDVKIKGLPMDCRPVVTSAFKSHGSRYRYGVSVFEIKR